MAINYDLTQKGPEVQEALDNVDALRNQIEHLTTDDVQDTAEGKSQAGVNTDLKSMINAETSRAQSAEAHLIELYEAITESDIIVGALPPTGVPNVIYRVPGDSSYADWMWDGGDFIKLAEYDNGIDDEPTAGSQNLVKSGGVANTYGECVDNSEWIRMVVDCDGKIIYGIKSNSELYYALEIPTAFVDYIENSVEGSFVEKGIEQPKDNNDFVYTILDSEDKIIFGLKTNGELYIAKEEEPVPVAPFKIVCWGDSLTAGAGDTTLTENWDDFCGNLVSMGYPDFSSQTRMSYVSMLQNLLGEGYQLINCGVGGEDVISIMARLGSEPVYLPADLSLPATTSVVDIVRETNASLPSKYKNKPARLLLQGHGNSVNPCYMNGIECTLSIDTPVDGKTAAYKISRNTSGTALTVKAGTPIILKGSSVKMDADISILWCWQNGGYDDNDDLVQILQNAVASIPNNKYIIIGLHSGNESNRSNQESLLEKTFGDKYFNFRRYISSIAMTEFGLTPTSADEEAMAIGSCPPSFLVDSVHLNAIGYSILGIKLYQIINILNY